MTHQTQFKNRKILITGASSGLGQASAIYFSNLDSKLFVCGTNYKNLQNTIKKLKNPKKHILFCKDLNIKKNILELANFAIKKNHYDVIIHCMGGGLSMRNSLIEINDLEKLFRINLSAAAEINRLIIDQINILSAVANKTGMKITHVKPHGALNNMACENYDLAKVISESITQVNKELIFLVPTGSQMEKAGKKLGMKVAVEIFADRNYEDDGNLVSRSKDNAMITDPEAAKEHVIKMVQNQAINCYSGKQIPCEIDSVCVHGDGRSAVNTAIQIKEGLLKSGISLNPLDKMKKFI